MRPSGISGFVSRPGERLGFGGTRRETNERIRLGYRERGPRDSRMMKNNTTKAQSTYLSEEQTSNMPAISLDLDPYLSLRALAIYSGLSVRTLRKVFFRI